MIILIIALIALSFVLFDKYCKHEWEMEDSELFLTEGTGHD
jgi:hypothetical protein